MGMHQVDRTLYFVHFTDVPTHEFNAERCNLVAVSSSVPTLRIALAEIERKEEKGMRIMGD